MKPLSAVVPSRGSSHNKRQVAIVIALLLLFAAAIISVLIITSPSFRSLILPKAASTEITFLGSEGTFRAGSASEFLVVKTRDSGRVDVPYKIQTFRGPMTITAGPDEKVWKCVISCTFFRASEGLYDYGQVEEGDEVTYIAIDNDVKAAAFLVDLDVAGHSMAINSVSEGTFTIPRSGRLRLSLFDPDVIGIKLFTRSKGGVFEERFATQIDPPEIDLSLTKEVIGDGLVKEDEVFTFKITISNDSPKTLTTATGVEVKEIFPFQFEVVGFEASKGLFASDGPINVWRWHVFDLPHGATEELTINTKIPKRNDTVDGTIFTNTALVDSANQVDVDSFLQNNDPTEDDFAEASVTLVKGASSEASPTPTLTPTPTPSPTPTSKPTPTPTPEPAPTSSPTPSPTSTPSPLPVGGSVVTPSPTSTPVPIAAGTPTPETLPDSGVGEITIYGLVIGAFILVASFLIVI